MSNTESVRKNSTAPIHSSSIAKLRSIGGGGRALTQAVGETDTANWLDAFSEIFARMAASDAAPDVVDTQSTSEIGGDSSSAVSQGDDSSQPREQTSDQAETNEASTPDQVTVVLPVGNDTTETEIVELEPAEAVTTPESTIEQQELPDDDRDNSSEEIVVADSNLTPTDDATPVVVTESLASQQQQDKRQSNQNQETVSPLPADSETAEIGTTTKQSESTPTGGIDSEATDVSAVQGDHDDAGDDSPRRSRHGRHDRGEPKPGDAVSQQNSGANTSNRSGGIPIPSNLSGAGEPAPLSTPPAPPPKVEHAASQTAAAAAVQAAAKVAAAATASASTRPVSTSPTAGTTNQVQASDRLSHPAAEPGARKPTAKTQASQASEAVNRAKLIQRVSKAFQHLGPDGGQVRLRLAPAELGTVRIEMRMTERRIQARVVAESEAAGSALREHLPELRQRLESQGLQIDKFEIEVDSGDSEARSSLGQHDSTPQDRNQNRYRRWNSPAKRDEVSHSVSRTDSNVGDLGGPVVTVPLHGGVDVRL
tara:strand:- start:16979 stop:18592 length:1614 start_codon:yes stop_codon:yes gene_type:complete